MDDARYDADNLATSSVDEVESFRYSAIPEDVGPEIMTGKNQKYGEKTLSPAVPSCMYIRTASANAKSKIPPIQINAFDRYIALWLTDVNFIVYIQSRMDTFDRAAAAPAAPQITAPQGPPPLDPPAAAPAAVDITTPISSPGPVAVFA